MANLNTALVSNNVLTAAQQQMYSIDLRLLNNRKAIELQSLTNLSEYDLRSKTIAITWKYQVIIEALEGLYSLGIQHSCDLAYMVREFESIAPSQR